MYAKMNHQYSSPSRQSGIPRPASRLPLPTRSPSRSLKHSPSRDRLQADLGLDAGRLRRPSEDNAFKRPLPNASLTEKKYSAQESIRVLRTGITRHENIENQHEDDGPLVSGRENATDDMESRGRPRAGWPSLSERTAETISHILPSPAPSRKQSSFFTSPSSSSSPMRSPSRAPSITMYSRSPSRSSRQPSGNDLFPQPPHVPRLPSRSRISTGPTLSNGLSDGYRPLSDNNNPPKANGSLNQQRAVISMTPPKSAIVSKRGTQTKTGLFNDFKKTEITNRPKPGPYTSSKPIRPVSFGPYSGQESIHVTKTRKSVNMSKSIAGSSISAGTSAALAVSSVSREQSDTNTAKSSKSSSALRESIAKAKAARRARKLDTQSGAASSWESIDDPFNQKSKSSNDELLRKRIEVARVSGRLNIAAMSLKKIPKEVITMYDFDPTSTTNWYESVDLVELVAADNDLAELPDDAFPDIDPNGTDSDINGRGNQFGGLERLDLRRNELRSLPVGIRRLAQLYNLNLSNNKLSMDDVEIITEISSLRDLKLANNQLTGSLTSNINRLKHLQALDFQGNALTGLPETMTELTSLEILNISQNQFTSLPFEFLSGLPLQDIIASNNKLEGTLIPKSINMLESLLSLDVSGNALDEFSGGDLELPGLQNLSVNGNRIRDMPNISSWKELRTLLAEGNALSELPHGLVELKKVRNVDLTGNNISKLDERIGLMESLVSFGVANNPLRDRRLLNLNTEDLLRELGNRCESRFQDTDDEEGSVGTQFTLAPEFPIQSTTWQVKPGGILDQSHSNMKELEGEILEPVTTQDVRHLYLQHNELHHIPPAVNVLAQTLVSLDLSNNPLDSLTLLLSPMTIPNLQQLNLSSAGIYTLDALLSNLSAPFLTHLDISSNRLSGPLPVVRKTYPNLSTVLAADNRLTSLDFDAVQGLQTLDVSNNDIDVLPPKLGLLRAEGFSKNWGSGSALRRFDIAGNRFRVPRWQVVEKGTDAVLAWLKDRIPAEELCEWEPDGLDSF